MARVLSQRTRQALLDLEGILDPNQMPERLALFDSEGNLINLQGIAGMPEGGAPGQHLAKVTASDYDTAWVDAEAGGGVEVYEQLAEPDTTNIGAIWIEQEPG